MKKKSDPRHQKRQNLVNNIFAASFTPHQFDKQTDAGQAKDLKVILANLDKIDSLIENAAPQWPIEKIAKIDLAILRLAVYELKLESKEPPKVVIDEAVELAKEYGSETSPSFINGVLGTLLKSKK